MRHLPDDFEGVDVAARGLSLRKALWALWLTVGGRRREVEACSVAYQDGVGALVFVMLFSSVVEVVLVDLLLSALWMRLLALALGLLALVGLLSFVASLVAYPHRLAQGTLTIHYGACFDLSVPLEIIAAVAECRAMVNQKGTAEVRDGVLSVPVMGVTNLVVTLVQPIRVHLRRTGVAEVGEIRLFAVDPCAGAKALRSGGGPENVEEVTQMPLRGSRWLGTLRWVGPVVLLVEIVLVTTGLLDWRLAAGVIAVTEGILTVLGVAAGVALVSRYRRNRTQGATRANSLSEAFFALIPVPMARMVRKELGFVRVLALALARRSEGARPGDVPLCYGGASRKVLLGVAFVLLASGAILSTGAASGTPWLVVGVILLYSALMVAAVGLASKVRPHVLRADHLIVRWGLHQELVLPLGAVLSLRGARLHRRAGVQNPEPDCFVVPASGREQVLLRLQEPIEVPTKWGRKRLADTILLPVDQDGTAAAAIAGRLDVTVDDARG